MAGDAFKTLAEPYIRRGITGGIPSLFSDLKTLYGDDEKREIIESIVDTILKEHDSQSKPGLTYFSVGSLQSPTNWSTARS